MRHDRLTQTVLVVDDEPRNIQLVSNVLKEIEGIRILYATNGLQAIERVENNSVDLILLDMMMPVMDGLTTCEKLHENPVYSEIPIIFLTAKNDEESLIKGFEAGAVDYITKPFLRRELIARVSTQLKLHSAQQELSDELYTNKEILKQYRDIVDMSSLVLKTDHSGHITYANEKFCEISGYTRQELLGKHHTMIRHPDMPDSVLKEMWQTISSKKSWNGIIKNLKKDGSIYIVDSAISPILDIDGEIIEYIGLHKDITEIIQLKEEVEATQIELLMTLGYVGESRSKETANHVRRVAEYAKIIADAYGMEPHLAHHLWLVSPLHDIGKIGIPDAILNKPSKLTPDEFEIIKTHAEIGWSFFKNSSHPLLQSAAIIANEHHERWDGKGYPRGLQGDDIHIFGRITAIADVFDALAVKRVYKEAWQFEEILDYFKTERGKQFDPTLIDLMLENLDKFLAVRERFQDEA